MSVIKSRVSARDPSFQANAAEMARRLDDLRARVRQVELGGGERARERHVSRGKLLPRDRIGALTDPGTPFLEFSQLAGMAVYEEDVPSAGVITGIGRVAGRECVKVLGHSRRGPHVCVGGGLDPPPPHEGA